jgi:hypothetical protein
MARLLALALALAALLSIALPASAIERNFAGSAQLDYHFVPTAHAARAYDRAFDGFTTELSGKLAVDLSDSLSANFKVCYGCHGFEVDMMYFDARASDELNLRVGRFSPSFGAFNLRHDPANHRLSDKPLPYDMGRMLRMRAWNQGVLPAPFPDNGIELNGTHWFGNSVQLDYAAYAVTGFKSSSSSPLDIDFTSSRSPEAYYVDNNGRPVLGGRAVFTAKLGPAADLTLGASGMTGTYDRSDVLGYTILGADLSLRVERTNLRIEYLVRRTEMSVDEPSHFKYAVAPVGGNYFVKDGAYVELEQPVGKDVDLLFRLDGMRRIGNVERGSELSSSAKVVRGTLGTAFVVTRGLRAKVSTEVWKFSDADPLTGRELELSFHLGFVGSY